MSSSAYLTFRQAFATYSDLAPDEETATAALLPLGSLGNIRTQTGRAYHTGEMR